MALIDLLCTLLFDELLFKENLQIKLAVTCEG